MPPDRIACVVILVHLIASSLHGWSHSHTGVPTNLAQNIFISSVIVAMPLIAGTFIALRKSDPGYALLSFSMAGSLVFGVAFHFVLDTPDLYANVCGAGARMFLASAILLALVELVGTAWAVYGWRRLVTLRSARASSAVPDKALDNSLSQS